MIEMAGIPTTMVTRLGFTQILGNAFAGFGFSAEAPTVYEFPNAMFLPGSDLTPLNENIDKVVYGLTKWQPKVAAKGLYPADPVTVSGTDYAQFVANVNNLFLKNQWGDGLPLTPPTEAQVKWILTGTDLTPDTVIGSGQVMAKGGIPTVESIAVNLAMAGGRPEYLPVLIAAVDAMSQPDYRLVGSNPTTQDVFPAVIVNGPIDKQIRLSSGYGVLGPDSLQPASATIGRALHLILQNLGGATPGVGTMAIYGAMRYTEAVVAEDEEGLPKSWTTLAEDRGFKKTDNVVTVTPVGGAVNVNNTSTDSQDAKGAQDQFLMRTARAMLDRQHGTYGNDLAGLVLVPRTFAQALEGVGYSKMDVKTFLWKNSQMSCELLTEIGHKSECTNGGPTPVVDKASDMMIVIAGGAQSGHAYWMNPGMGTKVQSKAIQLPKNWDALLKQAETDLGPIPESSAPAASGSPTPAAPAASSAASSKSAAAVATLPPTKETPTLPTGTPKSADDLLEITPQQLKAMIDGGADIAILDVQPAEMYAMGHIKGAVNVPWDTKIKSAGGVPSSKLVVVYCGCSPDAKASETDAGDIAMQLYTGFAYRKLATLKGGWNTWQQLGYPIETK